MEATHINIAGAQYPYAFTYSVFKRVLKEMPMGDKLDVKLAVQSVEIVEKAGALAITKGYQLEGEPEKKMTQNILVELMDQDDDAFSLLRDLFNEGFAKFQGADDEGDEGKKQ